MSLSDRPTHNGRPRLTLPGYRLPAAVPTAAPRPAEAYDPRRLSAAYHAHKLAELAEILGTAVGELPRIISGRVPAPLKIGIRDDLAARYLNADADAIGRWLGPWTSSQQYQMQLAAGGWRFDLDGCRAGEITIDAIEHARGRLKRIRRRVGAVR